jgi:hypothetical protein
MDFALGNRRRSCYPGRYEQGPGEPSRCAPAGACSPDQPWSRVACRAMVECDDSKTVCSGKGRWDAAAFGFLGLGHGAAPINVFQPTS